MLADLLRVCAPQTRLCIAADLTLATEFIATKTVAQWKKNGVELSKRPCIFLLGL
jgi:16S rRNA (cytidine1402-2'-O)-methyltransferase